MNPFTAAHEHLMGWLSFCRAYASSKGYVKEDKIRVTGNKIEYSCHIVKPVEYITFDFTQLAPTKDKK